MLTNNVQEITSSSGVGDVTLGGSSENGRTFSSQYALNSPIDYFIDNGTGEFESGVGHLSSSTVLVRDLPLDGSSSLPVNFSAGDKQVFVGVGVQNSTASSVGFSGVGANVKFMLPFNLSRMTTTQQLSANRQYFFEASFMRGALINLMGLQITTGGGTSANKMHIGLYEVNPLTGTAGRLIFEAANLDPSVAGLISGSVTETFVPAGIYILSAWVDVTTTVKANDPTFQLPLQLQASSSLGPVGYNYNSSTQIGLTGLPGTNPVTNATVSGGKLVAIALGHT